MTIFNLPTHDGCVLNHLKRGRKSHHHQVAFSHSFRFYFPEINAEMVPQALNHKPPPSLRPNPTGASWQ